MAYKTFANGFPLPASDLNNFLMNQSVIVFADSAARTTAIPSPVEGMLTYLEDTNAYESWNGSAFVNINDNTDAIPKSTVTTAQDLIVADGASSVTRLGVGTDDQVLSVVAGEVAWADVPSVSPITTEGDLIVGDDLGAASRLPLGTTGQFLSSDGTTAYWEDVAAGAFTLIASGTLTSSALSITSIPQTYKFLKLKFNSYDYTQNEVQIRFNSVTANDYGYNAVGYFGIYKDVFVSYIEISDGYDDRTGNSAVLQIENYADTVSTNPKIVKFDRVANDDGVLAVAFGVGSFQSSTAITSIQSVNNFVTAEYELYGAN